MQASHQPVVSRQAPAAGLAGQLTGQPQNRVASHCPAAPPARLLLHGRQHRAGRHQRTPRPRGAARWRLVNQQLDRHLGVARPGGAVDLRAGQGTARLPPYTPEEEGLGAPRARPAGSRRRRGSNGPIHTQGQS